jgi:glycosyltransferase involved in cell wall biosynthesis
MSSEPNPKNQLVAIALAAFEPNPQWFYEQLNSLYNQVHQNFICIICFDSQMDLILSDPRFADFKRDPRFQFVQNSRRLGYKLNFQKSLQLAIESKARYIAFCDQDDVWFPNKVSRALTQLEKAPHQLVFCNFRNLTSPFHVSGIDGWKEEKRDISKSRQWDLVARNIANGCSMVFDAATIAPYATFPDQIKHHDVWIALVFERLGKVTASALPGFAYRQHPENQIGSVKYRSTFKTVLCFLKNPWSATVPLFKESLEVYFGLESQGLARFRTKIFFAAPDLGFFLFLQGLVYLPLHPRTARSFFGRSMGKFFFQLQKIWTIFASSKPHGSVPADPQGREENPRNEQPV